MDNTIERLDNLKNELQSLIRDYNTVTITDISELFFRIKEEVLEIRKVDYDRFKYLVDEINKFTPSNNLTFIEVDCYETDDNYICIKFINK